MTLKYSLQKISNALELIKEFEALKFPHEDSKAAIGELSKSLQLRQELLKEVDQDLSLETQTDANVSVSEALEMLGIVANSANVRNAFEVHGPILKIAQKVIGVKPAQLILTFEWDYQPYTVPQTQPEFPTFVIIGLPASEASNALVLPAVGHELGHVLWSKEELSSSMSAKVNDKIKDLIKGKYDRQYEEIFGLPADQVDDIDNSITWAQAAEYCLRQIEEIFCDFTGLYIFGACFLDSFEYLLSPALHEFRDPRYPSVKSRAVILTQNAQQFRVVPRTNFADQFAEQKSPFEDTEKTFLNREAESFELTLADEISSGMAIEIADLVIQLCRTRELEQPDPAAASLVREQFYRGVPAENTAGLGAVLNAGWQAFSDPEFMEGETDKNRMAALNELILKTIEIYEIESITRQPHAA